MRLCTSTGKDCAEGNRIGIDKIQARMKIKEE